MKNETQTMAVQLAQPQGTALANIIPINSMEDISRLGIAVAKSGWFGSIPQSTGEMIAMTMLQERISPVTFKKKYHVMQDGSLGVASRAIVSSFKRLGGKMKLHEVSKDKCDITFSHDGNELRHCVTLQEFIDSGVAVSAKTGALKDNWAKFPMDMLYARCCSSAIRKVCPEADDGLYTAEEVADFSDTSEVRKQPIKIDKADVLSRLVKDTSTTTPAKPKSEEAPAIDVEAEVVDVAPVADGKETEFVNPANAKQNPSVSGTSASLEKDLQICPIKGPFYGVRFADMEIDILQFVLMPSTIGSHPELTAEHIAAAKEAAHAKGLEV